MAFTDHQRPIRNSRLMLLALQHISGMGHAPVLIFPNDPDLTGQIRGSLHACRLVAKGSTSTICACPNEFSAKGSTSPEKLVY